ncbi:MAG: 6-phosphogluconolactonase [Spirochaetes bacterium]|nr:6-phosphogluconolactonase [Spirochaetota bacterium]
MNREYMIVHSLEDLAETAAALWYKFSTEAVISHGHFSVALSGGSTPRHLFRKLSQNSHDFPWKNTKIFQVDERHVIRTHEDSNFRMISDELLSGIKIPPQNIYSIPVNSTVEKDAEKYSELLSDYFQNRNSEYTFDLLLLGLGSDGHTASLFPDDPALEITDRQAVHVYKNEIMHDRISITFPVINNAKNIIFLISGFDKSEPAFNVIKQLDTSLPAGKISHKGDNLIYLLDESAAALF